MRSKILMVRSAATRASRTIRPVPYRHFLERGLQMFQRMIDDVRDSTGTALRLTSLAAAAALALLVTTSFLCAAAFVFVLQKYGPVEACLAGAAIFFVVTLLAAGSYMVRKKQIRARAEQAAKEAARSA